MEPDSVPPARGKQCILIVEDDAAIAEMLTTLLDMEGFEVAVAGSGIAAITMLASGEQLQTLALGVDASATGCRPPDLILLDLELPTMDGTQMVQHLRELGQPVPPVIIVSARRHEAIDLAAQSIGAAGVLYKPFMVNDLLDQINVVLTGNAA